MTPELKELEFRLRAEYSYNKKWTTRLVENLIGGVSSGAMLYCVYLVIAERYDFQDWQLYVCVATIVFCLVNSIRFLQDEMFSIPHLFFRLGAASKLAIINQLQSENEELRRQLTVQHTSVAARQTEHANIVLQTAIDMLKLYYAGHKIDRVTCSKRGIREVDWNEARALMVKAGIVDTRNPKETRLIVKSYREAKEKLLGVI